MKHYEVIIMIHPDHSEKVKDIIEEYSNLIKSRSGKTHRIEDWGRKQLAYPINKLHKAHYLLMNIEINSCAIHELIDSFRYNEIILRSLSLKCKKSYIKSSVMMQKKALSGFETEKNKN